MEVSQKKKHEILNLFFDKRRITFDGTILDWSENAQTLTIDRERTFHYNDVLYVSWFTYDIVYKHSKETIITLIRVFCNDFYGYAIGTDIRDAQKTLKALE
ncbi:MAG: hypothetical protein ACRC0X_06595 [Brevinema sp.]